MGAVNKKDGKERSLPKSMRHKQILDIAAEQPEASLEEIAEDIPSATADLVENVLEKYGDPASDEGSAVEDDTSAQAQKNEEEEDKPESPANNGTDSFEKWTSDKNETPTDLHTIDVTESQREVLQVVKNQPEATQREIGKTLDVSAATVSNRVNSIPGFDWERRREIAETLFDKNDPKSEHECTTMTTPESDQDASIAQLQERVQSIEEHVNGHDPDLVAESGLADPELMHKVLHACLNSEAITEEEELQILKGLLR